MRIVLVTGKGGVGKTTVAAATAVRAAGIGHRTLVTSTDPAHSLADALGCGLGDQPTAVADGLEAAQLDGRARLERQWEAIRRYLVTVLRWGGVEGVQAEELSLLPGLEEVFALVDIGRRAEEARHDLMVVDCAPTAETLRLLSLPDALGWYLERVAGRDGALRALRPLVGRATSLPMPSDDVLGSVTDLQRALARVRELLTDGRRSTIRLVTLPERVVLAETRRTLGALGLFGYHVDAVVANRLLPEGVTDPFLDGWRQRQAERLAELRRDVDAPVLTAPLASDEPIGPRALENLAGMLHGDRDPAEVLHRAEPIEIVREGDEVRLSVSLPFAERADVDVLRRAGELIVRVGSHTRGLVLPASLEGAEVTRARLADGRLDVRLAVPDPRGAAAAEPTSAT